MLLKYLICIDLADVQDVHPVLDACWNHLDIKLNLNLKGELQTEAFFCSSPYFTNRIHALLLGSMFYLSSLCMFY